MNETQLLTVALTKVPTMIVILIGILIDNVRLTDMKETIRAEMRVVGASMGKNHCDMLHRVGGLDTRLTQIESALRMNLG
jgi:hypothetical protein